MTASTDAAPTATSAAMIRRYYAAMAVPLAIDVVTLAAYAVVNQALPHLPSSVLLSALFLLIGVGTAAYLLIRPVRRFMAGELPFAKIEAALASLPRHSCLVVAACYAPMLALRLPLAASTKKRPGSMPAHRSWSEPASTWY